MCEIRESRGRDQMGWKKYENFKNKLYLLLSSGVGTEILPPCSRSRV